MMLCILAAPTAFAGGYGMAGCGLGSMVMPSAGGGNQISAATTNGSFFSQPIGISAGTSNCLPPGKMAMLNRQEQFFASNITVLSKEMSQGKGNHLAAFAETFGCKGNGAASFSNEMQTNYKKIFSAPGTGAMFQKVRGVINESKTLNKSCDKLV
jgi:hypothetical protein